MKPLATTHIGPITGLHCSGHLAAARLQHTRPHADEILLQTRHQQRHSLQRVPRCRAETKRAKCITCSSFSTQDTAKTCKVLQTYHTAHTRHSRLTIPLVSFFQYWFLQVTNTLWCSEVFSAKRRTCNKSDNGNNENDKLINNNEYVHTIVQQRHRSTFGCALHAL